MYRSGLLILSLTALWGCGEQASWQVWLGPQGCEADIQRGGPPATRRENVVDVIHGEAVADPYRWLERASDPEVAAWTKAQDRYARQQLEQLPGRDALRERLESLAYVESVSPPVRRGDRSFFWRRAPKQDKAVLYVRDDGDDERVLLDPNVMSDDGSIAVHTVSPSPDGRLLAYKLNRNNADAATLYVRDVGTGRDLIRDVIKGARYALPSWTPDGRGFYYTKLPTDPNIPPPELPGHAEVRFHPIGSAPERDPVVHSALGDPRTFIHAGLSRDGRYLMLTIARGFAATDLYFQKLEPNQVGSPERFRPLTVGVKANHSAMVHGDSFYVFTNHRAPRYRIMKVDPAHPERSSWREIVPEADSTLEDARIVGGHLALSYLRRAHSHMEVRRLDGTLVREVELPGIGGTSAMLGSPDTDEAYFYFSSFTKVPRIYKTSIATGKTSLWYELDLPVDTSDFVSEQVWYESRDGTPISMFVVHRSDVKLDGRNPTLLTGYGGFGISMRPGFAPSVVFWVERGGVWAMPNLRGGGEYGEDWHEAGKLHNKQNVFDDFIAAAEYLVERGYTEPSRLAIRGGSNGGLLVGAVSTQRPELFGAVVCAVPLLDMVRYHLFGAGKTWIGEYGSADDPDEFRTLFAYSPYHRIREGVSYPPLLMLSADSDDRVDPMHARKYVAAMQAAVPGRTPVLLRVERNAGHGGSDLLKQAIEQAVDTYSFVFDVLAR